MTADPQSYPHPGSPPAAGADDGWNTWNPDRPAELVHLHNGFTLTPLLYSARGNRASLLAAGPALEFGPRALGGGDVRFRTALEDTRLDWRYRFDRDRLTLDWRARAHGEWGLRFWVTLCVRGAPGSRFDYDRADGVLYGRSADGAWLTLRAAKDPLLATFHGDLEALRAEFETHGYFYLASRGVAGHCAALRFNLEEAPAMRLRVASGRSGMPPAPARPALPDATEAPDRPHSGGAPDSAGDDGQPGDSLRAIHDVLAWNHVFDSVNRRPYTVLTRYWNRHKFGGFGVWMNDVLYHGLLWSLFDAGRARADLDAVFAWQTADGNLPCLVTGNDAWPDRSQPPIATFVVWALARRAGAADGAGNASPGAALLRTLFPALLRNHDWWWRRRRLGDTGLVAYGTSPDVGDGLYKGTKLAAKDESMMDNSPVHDPIPFDAGSGLLLGADVGLNSLLALDGELLAGIARELGDGAAAGRLDARSRTLRTRIHDRLWDPERQVFANRLLDGRFVASLAPTSFYPLAAGAADEGQTEALIERYLRPRAKFGGDWGLPSVSRDDPAYRDNVYWRGRVWAPLNFWVYQGLRRAGRDAEAGELAMRGDRLFRRGWRARQCGENYNAETGAITDQADSDPFYTWGALLPALRVAEVCDVTPWRGLSLAPARAGRRFGPLLTPLGRLVIENDGAGWRVERDGRPWLHGSVAGELTQLRLRADGLSLRLPASSAPARLALPGREIAAAELAGARLEPDGAALTIPPGAAARPLTLRLTR